MGYDGQLRYKETRDKKQNSNQTIKGMQLNQGAQPCCWWHLQAPACWGNVTWLACTPVHHPAVHSLLLYQ
jgi:hypothetical protein